MCVEPTKLPDGTLAACRYCWRCVSNYKNDWAGRCIAESEYSAQTLAVTLTYAGGDNNPSAVALVYDDFQRFMKRLNKKMKTRYLVAGEYGTDKERAHWHSILFLKDQKLNVVDNPHTKEPWDIFLERPEYQGKPGGDPMARIQWQPWSGHDENGFAYFQNPDYSGFVYVLEYVQKNHKLQGSERSFNMSKKPPLGHEYFNDLAMHYVEHGLAPQSWEYSFPHILDNKLRTRKFWMKDVTRANFVEAYKFHWQNHYGKTPHPYSPVIEEFDDKAIAEEMENSISDEQHLKAKNQWPKYQDPDHNPDLMNEEVFRQYLVTATIEGIPAFGLLMEGLTSRKQSLKLYTKEGHTWHGEGQKLLSVQRKGYIILQKSSRLEDRRDEFNQNVKRWTDQFGLFPPELYLPY